MARADRRSLILLRHAKSAWDDPDLDDHERPLAERGRRDATAVGRALTERRIRPDLVLCSDALRTRQTWQRAQRAGARAGEVVYEGRVYEASSEDLLDLVRAVPVPIRSLMLVGHGPGLPDLAEQLAFDCSSEPARRLRTKFPTSGLALFTVGCAWSELREAALLDFVVPRG